MNPLEKWSRTRQIGKSNFLVRYGIVPWSFGLTILFTLIEILSQGGVIWTWVPIRLILFAVVGFFIANSRWQGMESKYEASLKKN
jgi:hypothetical protein